jgi:putative glutamine amidotransferase
MVLILHHNDAKNTEITMVSTPAMVWLPADHRLLGNDKQSMPFLVLGDKYARAVKEFCLCQPVVFPLVESDEIDSLLQFVDGVVLTGSPSNVHPSHFGEIVADPSLPLDPVRDALTLGLVQACLRNAVPLLGICRGFQEINVALGGSLLQQVHAHDGMMDHREDKTATYDIQYGPAHEVTLKPGSILHGCAQADRVRVNSVHGQGVGRLAQGLRATAHADDGLVEAFEVEDAKVFAMAVQWHPEWRPQDNDFYRATFAAFGNACKSRRALRQAGTV